MYIHVYIYPQNLFALKELVAEKSAIITTFYLSHTNTPSKNLRTLVCTKEKNMYSNLRVLQITLRGQVHQSCGDMAFICFTSN